MNLPPSAHQNTLCLVGVVYSEIIIIIIIIIIITIITTIIISIGRYSYSKVTLLSKILTKE